ncbi:MAG: autotransporter-associated beta strand repeat-containing protein, partial [Roseomonas sp.]|nr:autotransporter-associated beta strand repeat-containing protein [Roseomonas sp.]
MAALLAAGGLVLTAPLFPQPALACGTILIRDIYMTGAAGYTCSAGPIIYTFNDSMVELDNSVSTSTLNIQVFPDHHVLSFNNLDGQDGVIFNYEVVAPTRSIQNIFHAFTSSADVPLAAFGVYTTPILPQPPSTLPTSVTFDWETEYWLTGIGASASITSITHVILFTNTGFYWDGGTGEFANNNVINGGPGTWNNLNMNWTLQDASINGVWPAWGTAIFWGPAGGLVNVVGTQPISGLEFRTDGYVLRGGELQLVSVFPSGIMQVDAGVTATIESVVSDGGFNYGIIKTGAGTLNLMGNNTYAGGTHLQQGLLGVGHNNALGTGALTMEANTTLRALMGNLTLGNAVTLNGGATIDTQSFALTLSGIVSGVGALTKTGTGDLILTGDNSYTGDTTVNAGTLQIAGTGRLGQGNYAGGIALNGGVFRYSSSADQTLSGVISGSGSVTKDGADSALTLTGNNTYTGGTFLQQGTLGVGHNNALGTGALAMAAGTTLLAAANNLNLANAVTLNGAGTVNTQAFGFTLGGIVSGAGDLTKTGDGTLTLTGNNTYTGGTFLQQGTLGVGHNNALGTGALTMAAGTTLLAAANNLNLANAVTLNG